MPILDESHDFQHPVEGDQAWSESYYFNCYDPGTDAGFYTRCGIRPNEGTLDIGLSFWLPGGGLAHMGGVREQKVMIDDDLNVSGELSTVTYERLAPLKQWRITARGTGYSHDGVKQISCDVVFDALTPAMGGDGQGKEAVDGSAAQTRLSVGKGHLEQAGQWSGWIEVDGVRHTLTSEARGNRDKSWGPRRWGGPKMWRWFSIVSYVVTHCVQNQHAPTRTVTFTRLSLGIRNTPRSVPRRGSGRRALAHYERSTRTTRALRLGLRR